MGFKALSKNQERILRLLAGGMTNAEIAAELGISEATAKSQITTVLERCGITGRHQARSHLASRESKK